MLIKGCIHSNYSDKEMGLIDTKQVHKKAIWFPFAWCEELQEIALKKGLTGKSAYADMARLIVKKVLDDSAEGAQ